MREPSASLSPAEDLELAKRLKNGDQSAFEVLYKRYYQSIYRFIYSMMPNVSERSEYANDLTQEVFTKVYFRIGQYQEKAKFSSWLYQIARNATLNCLQRKKELNRKVFLHLDQEATEDPAMEKYFVDQTRDPSSAMIAKEEIELLKKAIAALEEKDREVIVLCQINGLSYEEAAEIFKCTAANVRLRLHRAKLRLAKAMGASEELFEEDK